ncbi:MAG: hypothetical protein M1817_003383 [Caeruleum heppii]|nr:MAG: hypothetical protein M1817_003383 [Caeruleum heppii]
MVVAAHLVPASIGPELVDYIFDRGAGTRLFRPDNCLMLVKEAEEAADNGNITFVPLQQLQSSLRFKTLGDLDGKDLEFHTEHCPAPRFMFYHFAVTSHQNGDYATRNPWPRSGRYLGGSKLLLLARAIGDVSNETVAILREKTTFEGVDKIADEEEQVVGRRAMELEKLRIERLRETSTNEDEEDEKDTEDEIGIVVS